VERGVAPLFSTDAARSKEHHGNMGVETLLCETTQLNKKTGVAIKTAEQEQGGVEGPARVGIEVFTVLRTRLTNFHGGGRTYEQRRGKHRGINLGTIQGY